MQCTHTYQTFTGRSTIERLLDESPHARIGQDGKKCKYTSDILRGLFLKLCACHAMRLPPDVTHMMNFTRLPRFSVYIIETTLGTRLKINQTVETSLVMP